MIFARRDRHDAFSLPLCRSDGHYLARFNYGALFKWVAQSVCGDAYAWTPALLMALTWDVDDGRKNFFIFEIISAFISERVFRGTLVVFSGKFTPINYPLCLFDTATVYCSPCSGKEPRLTSQLTSCRLSVDKWANTVPVESWELTMLRWIISPCQ